MTALAVSPEPISVEELRGLFLFESLTTEQVQRLAAAGRVATVPAGSSVYVEGEPATDFVVLLSGAISLTRRVQQDDVEVTRTDAPGVYAGATQAYLGDRVAQIYLNTLHAITDCRVFLLPAETFSALMAEWFPMALHLLEGLFFGIRNSNEAVGQRERLIALGSLSAGLTHELNNPAAAASRAASSLRERLAAMRHKLAALAAGDIDPEQLAGLADAQEAAVAGIPAAPVLSAYEAGEREDELADWLDEHGIEGGWELAPTFVQAGLDTAWADGIAACTTPEFLPGAFRWLAYTLETVLLLGEIEDSTSRISALVDAAKQYSSMDRGAHQQVDVHAGLDATLVMLARKIGSGIEVVKEYDRTLPAIPAYPAELNQVWTNLVDNAVAAMGGAGTLTVRTCRDGETAVVEIADTGPGVPAELQRRIFEPFFTTKGVGQGTGLGLDISFRIVVNRHGGDLRVQSVPGNTRFLVRLPLQEPRPVLAGPAGT